jgi:hypothetical protein
MDWSAPFFATVIHHPRALSTVVPAGHALRELAGERNSLGRIAQPRGLAGRGHRAEHLQDHQPRSPARLLRAALRKVFDDCLPHAPAPFRRIRRANFGWVKG